MVGNCGASLAPLSAEGPGKPWTTRRADRDDSRDPSTGWLYGQYAAKSEAGKPVVNVAGLVGHGNPAHRRHGFRCNNRPVPTRSAACRGLLDEAMAEGAAGMSSGLYYAPGLFATTDEVVALAPRGGASRRLLRHPPAQRGRRAAGLPG